jgi:CAAX prenyl protease-like protein
MTGGPWPRTLLRNLALSAVLAVLHRRTPQAVPPTARGRLVGPALAALGPVGTIGYVCSHRGARCVPPPSTAARLMLAGHALAGAAAEELAWRGPLLRVRSRRGRLVAGIGAGGAFVATHLPRDGRPALPVHAVNTAAWTAAVLTAHRVRWSILAHAGYNVAAIVLRPTVDRPGGAA